jgi:hypothetical protein
MGLHGLEQGYLYLLQVLLLIISWNLHSSEMLLISVRSLPLKGKNQEKE